MLCSHHAPLLTLTPFLKPARIPSYRYPGRTQLRIRAYSSSRPDQNGVGKVEYTPWLIVGLGNPGNKYHGTRHNVGFEMIDKISHKEGVVLNTIQSKALIGIGSIGEVPILLAKPQSYMNYSGEAVGPLAAYYKVPLRHILLVYDEMSLPNGVLRVQPKGGHGHHNGVKSVMGHLDGRKEFPRLCIGIGNPPGTMDMKAFLLQKFSATERKQVCFDVQDHVVALMLLFSSLRYYRTAENSFHLAFSETCMCLVEAFSQFNSRYWRDMRYGLMQL